MLYHTSVIIRRPGKEYLFMTSSWRKLLLFVVVVVSARLTWAQQSEKVTITEPAVIDLASLFKQADTVALIKIVSGDAENYKITVYKGRVIKSFKGTADGETVYFGPYVGERIGWEYILFLRSVTQPIAPKSTSSANYGMVHYSEIFNEGYTSMMTSYECVFGGNTTAERCDDGVRVCTDYIVLPKSMPTFPPMTEDTSFGCRWVRKQGFISLLGTLGGPKK
jgi:hypothetical protein